VPGERVDGAESDPESALVAVAGETVGDGRDERDRVALEVRIVDPEGLQTSVAGTPRPVEDVVGIAAGGQAEADGTGEGAHAGLHVDRPGDDAARGRCSHATTV
jgi:hypothetical protein